MNLVVSNIDWDYPEKDEGKPCPEHLPSQIVIDDPILTASVADNIKKGCDETYVIAEWLTEKYGCCVCGFVPELEGVDIP